MSTGLEELQTRIDRGLREIPFNNKPLSLYEPIRYMLSLGGKRMRPVLTLMACELYSGDSKDAFYPALGIEVFHNFTLLHDDIMDNAPLRRTRETVHEKWNENIAILSGDAMFVKSVQLISQGKAEHLSIVLQHFLETALQVCEGQQMDMDFETTSNISIEHYLEMISLKTAVLIGCCLKTGAIIGGAEKRDQELMYDFGKNIGMVFQLQDDILDVYGDAMKFGKQPGGDIVANKKTYLLLKAFECAEENQYTSLTDLLASNSIELSNSEKVKQVTRIYDDIGVRKLAEAEMNKYYLKAMECINMISLPEKQKLVDYTDMLSMRQH